MLSNAQQTFGGPSYPYPTNGTSSTSWSDTSTLYPSPPDDVDNAWQMKEFWAPCNAKSAYEGLSYQLDLGPELPDNYLDFSGAYSNTPSNDNLHTVSSGFYAPLVTHPPISSVASTEAYDTSFWMPISQQDVAGYSYTNDGFTPHNVKNLPDTSVQFYPNPSAASLTYPPYPPQAESVASSHTEPSPQLPPSYTTRDPHHLPRRSPRTASTSPYPSPSPKRQQSGELTTYKRRNVQVPSAAAAVVSSSSADLSQANKWQCPFCPHIQHNRRSPDFKRHLETHTPLEERPRWVCCGVPYSQARALGLPEEVIREEAFEFMGTCMVGGCKKTFSRRDALSRHLRKTVGDCYGDAFAAYQPGNM